MNKDIKKALEHCAEWKCDNCPNGDELGSGEIVCRGRLLPEVLEYVTDLEAKLEESESEHELLIDQFEEETEKLRKQIKQESDARKRFVEAVKNLKQQLAEKEKEIENLNNRILISQLQAPEEQRLKIIGSSCCQYNPKRDKISFAVEQLEKVKEHFINIKTPTLGVIRRSEMVMYIDNQINELKGEK